VIQCPEFSNPKKLLAYWWECREYIIDKGKLGGYERRGPSIVVVKRESQMSASVVMRRFIIFRSILKCRKRLKACDIAWLGVSIGHVAPY